MLLLLRIKKMSKIVKDSCIFRGPCITALRLIMFSARCGLSGVWTSRRHRRTQEDTEKIKKNPRLLSRKKFHAIRALQGRFLAFIREQQQQHIGVSSEKASSIGLDQQPKRGKIAIASQIP